MKQENLSIIQTEVYKACPELKELSFGCQIRPKSLWLFQEFWPSVTEDEIADEEIKSCFNLDVLQFYESPYASDEAPNLVVGLYGMSSTYWSLDLFSADFKDNEFDLETDIEIIGHPIYLQHVLAATRGFGNWFIDDTGIFIRAKRIERTYDYTQPNIKWNLHEPLSNQSEETLQFLADLLSKNK